MTVQPAESIRRNAAFALAVRVSGALLTGGLTLFLVRYLGPDEYGVLALALSVSGLLLLASDFGVSQSAARYIAEHHGDRDPVGRVLGDALKLKAVGAGVATAGLIAAADPIASAYDQPELAWPLRLVAIALFGQSFMALFASTFEALGKNSVRLRMALSESAIEVSASVALVLAGAGVTGATLGRVIGYAFGAVIGALLATRLIGRARISEGLVLGRRGRLIAGYAGALFVIDAAWALFSHLDTLLIGAFLDPRSAALFSAPAYLLVPAGFIGLSLAAGVAPRLARHQREPPNLAALQRALRYLVVFQFALVPPLIVWAEPITELVLGSDYEESAQVFRGLAPYVFLSGVSPLLALSLNYAGQARRRVPLAISAVLINAAIDVILIPRIGIVAGAIGTDVAALVYVGGHLRVARVTLGLEVRGLATTFLRALLAAAAMASILFAFGTSELTWVGAIAGSLAALLGYASVILLGREFSREELLVARGALAGRWRRFRHRG